MTRAKKFKSGSRDRSRPLGVVCHPILTLDTVPVYTI